MGLLHRIILHYWRFTVLIFIFICESSFLNHGALLTWESCCVKHYWLEFLISCHYSMTIGEWNVFYFFPLRLCQQCLGRSHHTGCQQQAFPAKDLCCLSQKGNVPKVQASAQCVVPGIRSHQWQNVFWGWRLAVEWLIWRLSIFHWDSQKAIFSPSRRMVGICSKLAIFPVSLIWCLKKRGT